MKESGWGRSQTDQQTRSDAAAANHFKCDSKLDWTSVAVNDLGFQVRLIHFCPFLFNDDNTLQKEGCLTFPIVTADFCDSHILQSDQRPLSAWRGWSC